MKPLEISDRVRIQNQHGTSPGKWDRTGEILQVGEHDQYVVRVDGSNRTTLRNRRFLRKFEPFHVVTPAATQLQCTPSPNVVTSPTVSAPLNGETRTWESSLPAQETLTWESSLPARETLTWESSLSAQQTPPIQQTWELYPSDQRAPTCTRVNQFKRESSPLARGNPVPAKANQPTRGLPTCVGETEPQERALTAQEPNRRSSRVGKPNSRYDPNVFEL